jgi:Zn-dependent protease with chaperone function
VKSAVRTLFMDHPPTEKRIEQLQRLEQQLQLAGPRAA